MPSSRPLFGISYQHIDSCRCVHLFGFRPSVTYYHILSDINAACRASQGIPALVFLDGSWLISFLAIHGRAGIRQGLTTGEGGAHVTMWVSSKKCELRQVTFLQH